MENWGIRWSEPEIKRELTETSPELNQGEKKTRLNRNRTKQDQIVHTVTVNKL